jgi:hypothetical protein
VRLTELQLNLADFQRCYPFLFEILFYNVANTSQIREHLYILSECSIKYTLWTITSKSSILCQWGCRYTSFRGRSMIQLCFPQTFKFTKRQHKAPRQKQTLTLHRLGTVRYIQGAAGTYLPLSFNNSWPTNKNQPCCRMNSSCQSLAFKHGTAALYHFQINAILQLEILQDCRWVQTVDPWACSPYWVPYAKTIAGKY